MLRRTVLTLRASTPEQLTIAGVHPLLITATGHGRRKMCGTDDHGFPIRHRTRQKSFFGFQTGDMVRAVIPTGKYAGVRVGRIAVRARPSFKLNGRDVHPKYLSKIWRQDGYEYVQGMAALPPHA